MALPASLEPLEGCPMAHPLCPICRRVMIPQGPGSWRCVGNANHVLRDISAGLSPRKRGRLSRRLSEPARTTGITCPLCVVEAGMERDQLRPGTWRCSADSYHEFVNRPGRGGGGGKRPQLACVKPKPMGPNYLMDKAAPFWLSLVRAYGPVMYPPQSNFDGTMAMPGAVKLGGGSKSSRRKRRKKKGTKDRVEQWSEKYK